MIKGIKDKQRIENSSEIKKNSVKNIFKSLLFDVYWIFSVQIKILENLKVIYRY